MLQTLIALDERFFQFLHSLAPYGLPFWKTLAIFGVYVIPVFLVWYWFARRRETALLAALTGLFAWLGVNNVIASLVSRPRPTPSFDLHFPQKEFFFDRPGPSFPSDHAAFLLAVALIFYLSGERTIAKWLLFLTLITALARIVTAQHWPGDILAGLLVGAVTVGLIWPIRRQLDRWIIAPLVGVARRLGL